MTLIETLIADRENQRNCYRDVFRLWKKFQINKLFTALTATFVLLGGLFVVRQSVYKNKVSS
jgi:hypothetical protein